MSFSTSHLGHFQLTRALLPALRRADGGRVLTVTSGATRRGEIHWDDLSFEHGYSAGAAYGQSKRANVLFTVELDRRYADEGIRAFAAHPGVIVGPGPHDPSRLASYRDQGLVDDGGTTVIDPEGGKKTIEQGAGILVVGAVEAGAPAEYFRHFSGRWRLRGGCLIASEWVLHWPPCGKVASWPSSPGDEITNDAPECRSFRQRVLTSAPAFLPLLLAIFRVGIHASSLHRRCATASAKGTGSAGHSHAVMSAGADRR